MATKIISGWVVILILSYIYPVSLKAEIFKWVDENGKIHFSDQPNPKSKGTNSPISPSRNFPSNTSPKEKKDGKDFDKAMKWLINPNGRINNCLDFAHKMDQCTPYTCKMSHPLFGRFIISNTISGIKRGKCHYEQTMPNNGLMTCKFSPKQRKQFAQLHRDMFSGKTIESNTSVEMEASFDTNSNGKTQSKSKVTKNKSTYKVDGKESKNILNEALKNGDCVITGY